jgi:thiamine pyrophosphate-dependent acetolactate synthase large subunit-like protein
LIITSTLPVEAVHQLERLAERCAIPVVTHNPRSVCLPSSHSMHFGFEPGTLLTDADLVIALESDVPWIPHLQHPPGGCRVAHVGEDPFYVRYPMRASQAISLCRLALHRLLMRLPAPSSRACRWRTRALRRAARA